MSDKSLVKKTARKKRNNYPCITGAYNSANDEIEKEAKRLATLSEDQLMGNLFIQPKPPAHVSSAVGKKHSSERKLYEFRLKEFTNLRRKVWSMLKYGNSDIGWNTNPILINFFKTHNLIDTWQDYPPTFNHEKVKNMLLNDKKYSFVLNELIKNLDDPSYSLEVIPKIKGKKNIAEEMKKEKVIFRMSKVDFAKRQLLDLIRALSVGDVFRKPIKQIYAENGIKNYNVSDAFLLDTEKYDKLLWSFHVMGNRVKEIAKQRRWFGR